MRPRTLPCLCLLLILTTAPAIADTYHGPDLGDRPADFALRIAHSDVRLRYDDGTVHKATVDRLGVSLTQHLSPGLHGTLSAGYEGMTQSDNPVLAGQSPSGYYGGVALRGQLLSGTYLDAALSAHYTYHRLEATPTGQDITLSWHQAWADVVAGLHPQSRLRLYAGARYGVIGGDQRLSGTVNRTTGFQQDRHTGYFAGLDWEVDPTGHIGLRVDAGQFRGVEMSFARRF